MEMYAPKPNSPWVSLAILIGLVFAFSIGSQFIILIGYLLFSGDVRGVLESASGTFGSGLFSLEFTYVMLAVGTIGTFLLPPLLLQRFESRSVCYFPLNGHLFFKRSLLAILFLFCFGPLLSLVSEWNMGMTLPDSMAGIETWMRDKEDEMAVLTQRIVMTDSLPLLLVNIVVIAVLPAIGEELFFRGALQGILSRWFANYHLTIWITAFIFSAIHFQFYGFFPRLLLGVFFGYMLVWSQNIWIPILAHFVNNAVVALLAYDYTRQGKTYEDLSQPMDYHFSLYFVGLVASIAIGWYFYSLSLKQKRIDGTGLDKSQDV